MRECRGSINCPKKEDIVIKIPLNDFLKQVEDYYDDDDNSDNNKDKGYGT